ncbi:SDR family oxidoreductase [Thiolapillus sp.]
MSQNILITGATGHNGSEIIDQLSKAGIAARAMTRDPAQAPQLDGIEWVQGSFDDEASLLTAMQDIDRVFIVLPITPHHVEWMNNTIKAAQQAGVKQLVKLSGAGASTDSPSEIIRMHGETDALVKQSGLTWTLLQPNSFYQNILGSIATIKEQNSFYLPMKDASQSMIDVRDIAEVAVAVLTDEGHENQTYRLSGPEALNFYQVAEILSEVLGRQIQYIDVPPEAARQAMLDMGMPQWNATALAEILALFAQGHHNEVTSTVKDITGHAPRSFRTFAEDHRAMFQ